jgi:hypothetical protein
MRKNLIGGLLATCTLAVLPVVSQAGVFVGVSVNIAPPPLPVYVQPACPGAGYIWTPGYWAWSGDDYYWVPGTWVLAPEVGLLWTPGYWGWADGAYIWHAGYWGPHVGFYGGVNYGFGYTGVGFAGGYWHGHDFFYNRSVTNITNVHITNVYNKTVVVNNNVTVNRVSFNGGQGGIMARPTPADLRAEHEHHVAFSPMQRQHEQLAAANRELRASVNGGRPAIAATARPAMFSGHGVVPARAAGGPSPFASHAMAGGAREGAPHGSAMGEHRPGAVMGAHQPGAVTGEHQPPREMAMRTDRPPEAQHGAMGQFNSHEPRSDRPPRLPNGAHELAMAHEQPMTHQQAMAREQPMAHQQGMAHEQPHFPAHEQARMSVPHEPPHMSAPHEPPHMSAPREPMHMSAPREPMHAAAPHEFAQRSMPTHNEGRGQGRPEPGRRF